MPALPAAITTTIDVMLPLKAMATRQDNPLLQFKIFFRTYYSEKTKMGLRRFYQIESASTEHPDSSVVRRVLSEETFQEMISMERRRTERSRKPFLLMLMEMEDGINQKTNAFELNSVLKLLAGVTRDTDLVGWYTEALVAGVLFTEVEPNKKSDIVHELVARVTEELKRSISHEKFSRLRVSFHWFPESWQDPLRPRPDAHLLYPEVLKRDRTRTLKLAIKRGVDVVVSLVALTIGSPIVGLIALAIKSTSKGPVLYRQTRMGQNGRPFVLLKFRSMLCNNDDTAHKEYVAQLIAGTAERKTCNGQAKGVYKLTSDPRITRIGSFLRKSSLDELPQLINVLKGEMSLVGPRPPLEYEVDKYQLWHRRRIMEAKPGITGLWQVSGRNRLGFDEMVRLDLMYARSWSPWLDLKILLRTPMAVVQGAH